MKIGIIGAGFAGLATAKVLGQAGHDVVIFEKSPDVGGVWSATRRYPGVTTQSPRDQYSLSDYPMPRDYPEWPSGAQVQEYLAGYVAHFGLGDSLRLILNKNWFWFVEIDGEAAAFIVLLPNIIDLIHDLDGRLAPFGWAKLIWRLKFQPIRSARVPLMGVRRKFQKDRRGALAPFVLIDAIRRKSVPQGLQRAEYSFILEENRPMRHILEGLNARIYKTYRIYGKQLAPAP